MPNAEYVAGDATQNSIRVAQWLLQVPGATSYMGCVGQDEFADKMTEAVRKDGVNVSGAKRLDLGILHRAPCGCISQTTCINLPGNSIDWCCVCDTGGQCVMHMLCCTAHAVTLLLHWLSVHGAVYLTSAHCHIVVALHTKLDALTPQTSLHVIAGALHG